MEKYLLTCDTAVDLNNEYLTTRNIPFVGFHYTLDDKEYTDDLGKSLSYEEFYKKIDAGSMPITSQINIAQGIEFFEPLLKEGYDILHLAFSSGLSGTYMVTNDKTYEIGFILFNDIDLDYVEDMKEFIYYWCDWEYIR